MLALVSADVTAGTCSVKAGMVIALLKQDATQAFND